MTPNNAWPLVSSPTPPSRFTPDKNKRKNHQAFIILKMYLYISANKSVLNNFNLDTKLRLNLQRAIYIMVSEVKFFSYLAYVVNKVIKFYFVEVNRIVL